ncbi:hypothetical protein AX774_g4554 [Zancudomyces culisetae]|uniref:Secreted protein n=1 Tax=Zancudomyces culisetae TaxID=1213189 RepID=A0A1R1PM81_ZANCU|nr:hypothetical protein AX774_g4554 [Zancudomyces culisetae]|eukprot:OMH81982.1 hypothetical protein AX774_g4554 [Zancudomyces culisetae]
MAVGVCLPAVLYLDILCILSKYLCPPQRSKAVCVHPATKFAVYCSFNPTKDVLLYLQDSFAFWLCLRPLQRIQKEPGANFLHQESG